MNEEYEPASVSSAYDRWSQSYDSDVNRTRDLDAVVLRANAPKVDGLDVLELGCGTGKNSIWLAERARSVVGLDASAGMLSVARRRVTAPSVTFIEHDILKPWPIATSSTDVVIVDLVLEHVQRVGDVFAEAARVLRPDGALFMCELHPHRQLLGARAHFTDAMRGTLVTVPAFQHSVSEFLNGGIDAGLEVERVGEWWDAPGSDGAETREARVQAPPRLFSVIFRKR